MMERLRRFRRQRMPLLLGGLALLLAITGAVGMSFTPAVRSALLPVRASGSAQLPTHAPTRAIATTGPVSVLWGDSTALAGWNAMQGAAGYRVTLIRANDMAIMEQVDVPATQLRFDAQGIWPGNQYVIAVQALDGNKHPGAPIYSGTGQAVPIDRSQYPGFLDTMGLPAGAIDHNLWDQRGYGGDHSSSASFINGQIHGHLETGQISYEQSIASLSPRAPFDFTGRTGHLHGEVDFHGNVATWFGVLLGPRHIGGNEMFDVDDRLTPRGIPFLELFNDNVDFTAHPHLRLVESLGGGKDVLELGTVDVPDYSLVNVRNFLDMYVSTTHVRILVDGHPLIDRDLPVALPFSVGYLTLAAESYPKVDEDRFGQVLPCDVAITGACNVWHLDNWGFDAPLGQKQMPALTENRDPQCADRPATLQVDPTCDSHTLPQTTAGTSVQVNVQDASQTASARVVFDAYRGITPGTLQVAVNGSAWQTVPWLSGDLGYINQVLQADVPVSALRSGANSVRFRVTAPTTDGAWVSNVAIEQSRTFAYTPPPLPPEPAPIGTWVASIPGAHP